MAADVMTLGFLLSLCQMVLILYRLIEILINGVCSIALPFAIIYTVNVHNSAHNSAFDGEEQINLN